MKFAAKGSKISYLAGSAYVDILQVESYSYDLGTTDNIEVTTLDSVSSYREYLPTWKSTTPLDVEIIYDPGLTSHAWLRTNHGTTQGFKVTLSDAGTATEVFQAIIEGLKPGVDVNGAITMTATLKPTGVFTHTA